MDFEETLWTALGAGLILLMLADVFHTLLYPHGSGPVGGPSCAGSGCSRRN